MIVNLLSKTLNEKPKQFEYLIVEIVRAGITYRARRDEPVHLKEIDLLNGYLLELGCKFPDLWDPEFRTALEIDAPDRAREILAQEQQKEVRTSTVISRIQVLADLEVRFFELLSLDPHKAGYELESLLNRLFQLEGLSPREPFRVVGEQIDGSFDLDHETYLLEAKWTRDPVPESDLLIFRGKIEGKSAFTRGMFVSLNGISSNAKAAITKGKRPSFFVVDGHDMTMLLANDTGLPRFLRQRQRILAERGEMVVAYNKL
jgi:hypothetical protein